MGSRAKHFVKNYTPSVLLCRFERRTTKIYDAFLKVYHVVPVVALSARGGASFVTRLSLDYLCFAFPNHLMVLDVSLYLRGIEYNHVDLSRLAMCGRRSPEPTNRDGGEDGVRLLSLAAERAEKVITGVENAAIVRRQTTWQGTKWDRTEPTERAPISTLCCNEGQATNKRERTLPRIYSKWGVGVKARCRPSQVFVQLSRKWRRNSSTIRDIAPTLPRHPSKASRSM